ncbi:serine hydrolase domain-containing protein [Streptomyces sp. SBT349]|uniref:serine hydrolase domain-containing protein n=1 Tax=Streptomyces sp. SBT349 TaxID=1580539 RepID=UPI00066A3806|nr:serine hydrolase domain-containing protein [Streptomyces sp. SBT349]
MTTAATLDALAAATAERLAEGRRGALVVGAVRGGDCGFHGADPRTLFAIGSVTRTFTALALARLAVRGEVALDQPVGTLLPEGTAMPERDGRAVELGHLATHTSGLPDLPRGMLPGALRHRHDPYARCTPGMVLAGLGRTRLRSVPGERFHCSGLGMGLLGLALARATGRDDASLIRAEICDPLGMSDTHQVLDPGRAARLARGHSRRGRPVPPRRPGALAAAGGLHSTAADLATFAMAHLGDVTGQLARAMALTRETRHRLGARSAAHPGWIGLRLPSGRGGHEVLFHNGGTGGHRALLAIAPERQAAVVVLSATARSVDRAGLGLLIELAGR